VSLKTGNLRKGSSQSLLTADGRRNACFVIALLHFCLLPYSVLVVVVDLLIADAVQFSWVAGCVEGNGDSADLPCPQGF